MKVREINYDAPNERLNIYHKAWELVQEQAEDEGLWFCSESISEAYLQQELRRLHAVIEGDKEVL